MVASQKQLCARWSGTRKKKIPGLLKGLRLPLLCVFLSPPPDNTLSLIIQVGAEWCLVSSWDLKCMYSSHKGPRDHPSQEAKSPIKLHTE